MAHPELAELFTKMPTRFQPDAAGGMNAVLQFELSGDKSGDFYVTIKDKTCAVAEGKSSDATTTFKLSGQDWIDMAAGKADGMGLFMQGRLSVEGDMGAAMKMQSLFKN